MLPICSRPSTPFTSTALREECAEAVTSVTDVPSDLIRAATSKTGSSSAPMEYCRISFVAKPRRYLPLEESTGISLRATPTTNPRSDTRIHCDSGWWRGPSQPGEGCGSRNGDDGPRHDIPGLLQRERSHAEGIRDDVAHGAPASWVDALPQQGLADGVAERYRDGDRDDGAVVQRHLEDRGGGGRGGEEGGRGGVVRGEGGRGGGGGEEKGGRGGGKEKGGEGGKRERVERRANRISIEKSEMVIWR